MSRQLLRLKEFRIHLCQKGTSSKGVRDFIEQHYVSYKQANPTLPILIRECSGVQPKLWARYGKRTIRAFTLIFSHFPDKGQEKCTSLKDLSASEVMSKIKSLEE